MTIQEIDEQGDLCFFSSKVSSHFDDIEFDERVQVMYADNQKQSYLSIYSNVTHIVLLINKKLTNYRIPILNNWFEGKDNSNLILSNVNIDNAYYWNTVESKLLSFF